MKNKPGYWNIDKAKIEALKYNSRKEFSIKSSGAYDYIRRNNLLDTLCQHMIKIGNYKKRLIYCYEFSDNHVYVGLTCNIKIRHNNHLINKKSSVYKHIEKTGLTPVLTYGEYIFVEDAIQLENETVNKYKDNKWLILNKARTGSIGRNLIKWTHDELQKEALKYDTRNKFKKLSCGAYCTAHKLKILDVICSHMITTNKPAKYWTKEECKVQSLNYKSRKQFEIGYRNMYLKSLKNGWLDEFYPYNEENRKPANYWTKEKCKEESLKHSKRYHFKLKNSTSYYASLKNGWLDEFYPKKV